MKTTVYQYGTIYMLYYSEKIEPGYEMCKAYINEEDAFSARDKMLDDNDIYMAYVINQTLW